MGGRGRHHGHQRPPGQRRLDLQHPTQFYITIYRCMATQEGHTRGLEAADILKQVLDLVGLPIEGVRANLHDAPVVDPFRATR
jgi:hypothetical protein